MHLLLSPHPDDIAYSLGGTVLKGYIKEGVLVTIFQRSSHVPNIHPSASLEEGSAIRYQEDKAYAEEVGLAYQGLGLKEAMDRGYQDFAAICREDNYLTDASIKDNICMIQSFLEQQAVSTLWVPLSIGYHIDHVIVNRSVLDWETKKKLEIIFYEDIPYAAYVNHDEIHSWITEHIGPVEEEWIDIGAEFQEKLRNIEIYKSQLNEQDRAGLVSHAKRLVPGFTMERIWRRVN